MFLFAGLILSSFSLNQDPQSNVTRNLLLKLQNHYNWYPQQKVYLHLDKTRYRVDETLWYKAYVVDASSHKPDQRSTNLYVELINPSGFRVQTRLLKLDNGIARGDFSFNDTIPEGRYRIKAYTNWMRNLDEEFFYTHDVYISNPFFSTYADREAVQKVKKGARVAERQASRYDVSFHPEGGYLLSGVEARVAFKAVNDLGPGVDIRGELLDNKGNKILDFESLHAGMGSFTFTPAEGNSYKAVIYPENLREKSVNLPEAIDRGVSFTTDHLNSDNLTVNLITNIQPGEFPPNTRYFLVAHTRGIAKYSGEMDLNGERTLSIPKSLFSQGITHLTLFNTASNPISERLVFIDNRTSLNVEVMPQKSLARKRENLNVNINVTDMDGNPVEGEFSLAVIKTNRYLPEDNILSNLLLTSDLKGHIEFPESYFDNRGVVLEKELDNLLLTQGWKRFDWTTVNLNINEEPEYNVEEGIVISGRITRELFSLPLRDIKVQLTILNEYNDTYVTRSDMDGNFSFRNLDYPDTVSVMVEAWRESGKKNLVIIMDQNLPTRTKMNYLTEQYLKKPGEEGRWAVPEEEEDDDPYAEDYIDFPRIHSEPNDVIIVTENMQNMQSVSQIIQGRVPGVMVSGNSVRIRGINSFYGGLDPLFLLDGIPVDAEFALSMPPYDVDRIEILKGPEAAIYGSRGANGVIAIYTKRGRFMKKGVVDFKMLGYYTPKEFYQPRYDIRPDENFEDIRTTLFWEPAISLDNKTDFNYSFYTSDVEGEYMIRIEGIDANGNPGTGSALINVR